MWKLSGEREYFDDVIIYLKPKYSTWVIPEKQNSIFISILRPMRYIFKPNYVRFSAFVSGIDT